MATKRRNSKDNSDDVTKALNEIINQNLTIGISTFNDDTSDFNDDHADMKSNASNNWRRGSVSYSQPSSPKGNPSLSPVSSVSSLSDLSTENYESMDSESCASLNSNDSSFHAQLIQEFMNTEDTIHEHKQDIINIPPIPTDNKSKNMSKITSKNTLKVPNNKRKKKKKKNGLTKSISYEQTLKLKPMSNDKPKKRRNSKDCLDITIMKRLTNKSIELWTVSDVVQWVKYIDNGKHRKYANNFRNKRIDGKKLFKMNRSMLQSIEIYHPSARKGILAALHKLKKKVRQTSKKQTNLYAKTHSYEKKKLKRKQRKHQRVISNLETTKHKLTGINSEMYIVAVKKRQSVSAAAEMTDFSPVNKRKYSANMSEFMNEWDIDRQNNINFVGSNILEQTDNFTMIQLSNGRIVYAVTARVEKWTTNDVCKWLNSVADGKFKKFIAKFKQRNTNGFDLLNISRVQLQNNIQMKDIEMRNILLREIKLLKIATKPMHGKLLKKRISALSVKEMQLAKQKEQKRKGKHRKSASLLSGMGRSQSHSDLYDGVPKKLGPRDIGRNKNYKGTKWERKLFEYDFLEEKLNYKASSECFNQRKMKNPVQHKETVDQIGIVKDFHKPEYTNDVLRNITRGGWLKDKPISRPDVLLDKLKGTKVPKNSLISEINSPIGWTPIKYECKEDGKEFLEEHFWFDGSGVKFEFSFSRLIKCLPSNQLLKLNKQASPTGYQSKLNWLKMLLNIVTEEMEMIRKEDALYEQDHENINIIITPTKKSQIETVNISETLERESIDITPKKNIIKSDDKDATLSLPDSVLSESDQSDSENILSSPNNLLSPDMNTKRTMYKTQRNRANTNVTLANSTLSGVKSVNTRSRQRTLSIQDINRRRFLSQESVTSIQAIISNIEKKRAQGNKIEQVID